MTKWQLPQGVEYPIGVWDIKAKFQVTTKSTYYHQVMHVHCEDILHRLIRVQQFEDALSIRINNSIDLVKIEE